mmetsp:Transcript_21371/g.41479  ORF Transcript_21371/g.41479 Transcript_21371/m.41479 type:complete len:349 (+) Transcript_21371:1817-2863(+)
METGEPVMGAVEGALEGAREGLLVRGARVVGFSVLGARVGLGVSGIGFWVGEAVMGDSVPNTGHAVGLIVAGVEVNGAPVGLDEGACEAGFKVCGLVVRGLDVVRTTGASVAGLADCGRAVSGLEVLITTGAAVPGLKVAGLTVCGAFVLTIGASVAGDDVAMTGETEGEPVSGASVGPPVKVKTGAMVGASLGATLTGALVGCSVGCSVWATIGLFVLGPAVGTLVGSSVGAVEGTFVVAMTGAPLGASEGAVVGFWLPTADIVGSPVGVPERNIEGTEELTAATGDDVGRKITEGVLTGEGVGDFSCSMFTIFAALSELILPFPSPDGRGRRKFEFVADSYSDPTP